MARKLLELFEIITELAMAALMVYVTILAFRAGSDFWFAAGVPLAAYSIWRFVKVGEPKGQFEVRFGMDARDAATRAVRDMEWRAGR